MSEVTAVHASKLDELKDDYDHSIPNSIATSEVQTPVGTITTGRSDATSSTASSLASPESDTSFHPKDRPRKTLSAVQPETHGDGRDLLDALAAERRKIQEEREMMQNELNELRRERQMLEQMRIQTTFSQAGSVVYSQTPSVVSDAHARQSGYGSTVSPHGGLSSPQPQLQVARKQSVGSTPGINPNIAVRDVPSSRGLIAAIPAKLNSRSVAYDPADQRRPHRHSPTPNQQQQQHYRPPQPIQPASTTSYTQQYRPLADHLAAVSLHTPMDARSSVSVSSVGYTPHTYGGHLMVPNSVPYGYQAHYIPPGMYQSSMAIPHQSMAYAQPLYRPPASDLPPLPIQRQPIKETSTEMIRQDTPSSKPRRKKQSSSASPAAATIQDTPPARSTRSRK
jgi:hypothetical protein